MRGSTAMRLFGTIFVITIAETEIKMRLMENKETIKPGKYTELVYKLYQVDADGKETLVYESEAEEPEKLIFGVTRGVLPVLEKALDGLAAGEKFEVTATPDEAFGHHDPEQVVELDREVFEIDGKFDEENIKAGNRLPMMTADGSGTSSRTQPRRTPARPRLRLRLQLVRRRLWLRRRRLLRQRFLRLQVTPA